MATDQKLYSPPEGRDMDLFRSGTQSVLQNLSKICVTGKAILHLTLPLFFFTYLVFALSLQTVSCNRDSLFLFVFSVNTGHPWFWLRHLALQRHKYKNLEDIFFCFCMCNTVSLFPTRFSPPDSPHPLAASYYNLKCWHKLFKAGTTHYWFACITLKAFQAQAMISVTACSWAAIKQEEIQYSKALLICSSGKPKRRNLKRCHIPKTLSVSGPWKTIFPRKLCSEINKKSRVQP